jgi:DNA polymerase-3 subunit alpha
MGVTTETKNKVEGALLPSSYVHLHNHTHHSLLDGLSKIPALIDRVKELGMEAVAITDHGTMSGTVEFYKAAKAAGIKPIIGMEAYVAARSRHDRDPQKDKGRYHLIILAMNNQGYKNLMRLSSLAQLEGMYYKPRIDHELLEKYNEGLIILSGCAGSELGENLQTDNYEEAKKIAAWYKSVFGDRYYLELQDHGHLEAPATWDMQVKINNHLEKIASELDIPIVVTSDGHYLTHDDQDAHEILLCVGTGSFLADEKRMSLKNFELHVTEPEEIISRWQKTHPEAVTNTKAIADRCNVELELGGILIPTFPTPKGYTEKTYLDYLVFQGLAWRYGGQTLEAVEGMSVKDARKYIPTHVLERADYELGVIDRMGFNGYFLIVQDFINWGKDRGIIFGPGRGSAAGSIVSYAVRITELDPLHYDLLFERFLNPDRISMPDVDIDIQDTRRDEVIAYCTEKYGVERVANIVTFGTMAARAAVRDVARVLQVPYADSDRLAKLIPPPIQGRHIPLSKSIVEDADLKHEYESNPITKQVLDYAIRLEGTIRSHGVHAAGVVIAPTDIVNYAPVEMSQKGVVATQYPMGPIEELGLLKMDFLGLSNLTIINNALRIIKKVYKTDINLAEIPLDDEKTFTLLQRGDTTGVFQLESAGMKRYLRDLQPTVFDDIIAMCALYRPGPLGAGLTDSFVKRKNGKEPVTYEHELTKNALESTYGVIVYQEQVMQMSKEMSGFTGGEADTLRKGIGKKIPEVMAKMGQKFIDGAITNGVPKTVVEKIWKDILGFADYAFNKSHSACYGLIAYWTAYLKAHYPEAFMAALMTSDADNIDRLAIEISECQHMGIKVLSPDINESFVEFAVVPGEKEIRFGMAAVKGVGTAVVEEILRAREDGRFASVEDFAKRVSTSRVNKKAWDSLIKTGAFDELADRSDLLFNLETIQAFASKVQKEALSGQTDLFGGMADVASIQPTVTMIPAPVKHTEKERLTWERELLGLYISSHPLDNYDAYFEEQTIPIVELTSDADSKLLTVGGLISTIRTIITKSGSKMAFVKLEDKTGETEVIVFPNLYEQLGSQLIQDAVIRAKGKVTARDKDGNMIADIKMIADEINIVDDDELRNYESNGRKMAMPVNRVTATRSKWTKKNDEPVASLPAAVYAPVEVDDTPKKLYVHVKDPEDADALLKLKEACGDFPGVTDIVLVLGADKHSAIKMPFKVETTDELVGRLVKILGEDAVVLK